MRKKSEEQELKASNLLGRPNLEAGKEKKNQEKGDVDFTFGFDVPDELLCNILLPESEVQKAE